MVDGKAVLQARCPGEVACKGLAKLTVKANAGNAGASRTKALVVGSSRFSIPAGRAKAIKIALNATGKQLVKGAGTKGLAVQLVGTGLQARTIKLKPGPGTPA